MAKSEIGAILSCLVKRMDQPKKAQQPTLVTAPVYYPLRQFVKRIAADKVVRLFTNRFIDNQ